SGRRGRADLDTVEAAADALDRERVDARIADAEAVRVLAALVDRQVVGGRESDRRGDVVDRDRLGRGVAQGVVGVLDLDADRRARRAVREAAHEAAAGGGRRGRADLDTVGAAADALERTRLNSRLDGAASVRVLADLN